MSNKLGNSRNDAAAAEREYYRNLSGDAGKIFQGVFGYDEEQFAGAVEYDLSIAIPRLHVADHKIKSGRWKR